ncbi:hypothetical protein [Novosphingobium sp. NDB2Meth1]|uniref:hypothetical protein n=1 Tax=Novosphingobium sp. NDB2Meth1 TaxID=1892847 RepID=UPI000930AE37|nr:hypothetical protein [Novosphingobium sp. NDB2Meth1]
MKKSFLILLLLVASCTKGAEFDRERWLKADLSGRERANIMPDLVRKHRLYGMTRTEVVALLGPPTPTDKWAGSDMVYVLGNDGSLLPIDHAWLTLTLDKQERVVSFKQTVD